MSDTLVFCPCGCRTLMTFEEMWFMLFGDKGAVEVADEV